MTESDYLEYFTKKYPEKFLAEAEIFNCIQKGSYIFVGSACAQPQYLMNALTRYIDTATHHLYGTDVIQVWTLGVAPFTNQDYERNFAHNSFFISSNSRDAVNSGRADYTPVFLSQVPDLFNRGIVHIDVALIQTSLPDKDGNLSLGISVDIVKAAVKNAKLIIAQVNKNMPVLFGDSFINLKDVNFIIPKNEPLIEYSVEVPDSISKIIAKHIARLVQDGDTLQVGYGSMPNAILSGLSDKNDLGIHTELLTDGIVNLMTSGVINNSRKPLDHGKTIASFCMGKRSTYRSIHKHPDIRFMQVDYTNNIKNIMAQHSMTAINSSLQIDLTGQATSESIGSLYHSGIGGQADFMRGAILAPGGKSILAMRSTSNDGINSRIIPQLLQGSGVTLNRGDVHYVVTEYGIAHLYGKNIRERAISLISVAHPDFREWLFDEAKKINSIPREQKYIPGMAGEYPKHLEHYTTTKSGLPIFIRPSKISDEDLLKKFFYSQSDNSIYRRFISAKKFLTHKFMAEFVVNDYSNQLVMLAITENADRETVVGIGQYKLNKHDHRADVAFSVRDDFQNQGIASILISVLSRIAKKEGIIGFTADMLAENSAMNSIFIKAFPHMNKKLSNSMYEIIMDF
jgi:acyl-CoA hydrolase/GNAT superfamily N-acetyltransferase